MRGDWNTHTLLSWLAALAILATGGEAAGYFGKRIGRLEELHHLVQGEVYAVDSRTIHIRGFSYDGTAPDAFFYGGSTPSPSDAGFIIPDENGGVQPLGRYRNKDLTLTLPDGKTLKDIKWLSVWCRAFAIDFGNVRIPASLDYPRPQKIDALPTYEHGVSSDRIVVVDAQTFLIPNFNYDGQAPDGHFWVGKGASPGPAGNMVPDENGSEEPLKRYSGKTIVITLPGEQTVFDIDYLSVWCRAFFADFGHVRIPKNLNVPPSLKMLGVAPQTKLNCEVLWDDLAFEVRWAVAGESIVMQLVGRIENGQYMAFGPSGSLTRSVMVGGDVVVAWLNQGTGEGVASDYYLGAKAQCQGGRGSCPDDKIRGSGNNVRLLNAALINEFTMLTFQRPLRAVDISDTGILTNGSQAVIWAIGPVNSQGDTSYHTLRLRGDMFIDFGRTPRWNCPLPEEQGGPSQGLVSGPATPPPAPPTNNAWYIPPVPCYEPADGVFYAQIGPSGGDSGYNAITGHVGWGVAWYINGLLIPEINVVRGKTYTFVVEGGYDPERPARYHPFYITDDPEGGYEFKTPAERAKSRVFAGVGRDRDGLPVPTAFGRLCEWTENPNQPSNAFQSFGAYQRTLELNCQEGQPGILQWTPDAATPDTVYYQCYTHRYLGWKINVVDQCDFEPLQAAGTVEDPVVVPGPQEAYDYYDYDSGRTGDVATGVGAPSRLPQGFNRIPGQGFRKPQTPRQGDHRFPGDFDFPNFPHDFPAGFDSFPFDVDADDDFGGHLPLARPRPRPRPPTGGQHPHIRPPKVPLGAPGFKFPKLPSLKSPSSVVNASAFANLGEDPSRFFGPQDGDLDFPDFDGMPLANQFPELLRTTLSDDDSPRTKPSPPPRSRPSPSPPSSTSTSTLPSSLPSPSPSPSSSLPPRPTSSSTSSTSFSRKPKPPRTTTTAQPTSTHSTTPPRRTTPGRPTPSTRLPQDHSGPPTQQPLPQRQPTRHSTPHRPSPTPQRPPPTPSTPPPARKKPVIVMAERFRPTPLSTRPPTPPQESSRPPLHPLGPPQRPNELSRPHHSPPVPPRRREPEVITAPSLPRLPGQFPSAEFVSKPCVPPRIVTAPSQPPPQSEVSLGDAFAQNFGFDPTSVVYENDFRPVRKSGAEPVLAFEVSSTDVLPVRVNPRPPVPIFRRRPAGPRTSSGNIRFAHRHIQTDDDDIDDENESDAFSGNPNEGKLPSDVLEPLFHPSVPFSERLEPPPMPLPVPMVPVIPLLGGAASNQPLQAPNPRPQPPPARRPNPAPRPPHAAANRLGRPQTPPQRRPQAPQPPRRQVTALVKLPDHVPVPVPQAVGPQVLLPVINFPVSQDGEVMKAAESTQLFTTDGRRLPPESLPAPPELSRRRVTAASITNRPQVGVFRGEHPPPIPDHVPHLPQFSRQRRPSNRRTTVPPPPLPDSISPEILIPHHQDNPRPAAGLLHHQPLSADVGQNRVLAVDQFPTTAAAYAPSRPPATPPTTASSANSRTKLTILKDVWAILTRDDPSLKNQHHPRDDAHPKHDHDHLDRQERRRRRRKRAEPEGDLPPHASSSLPLRTSSLGLLSILVFLVALAR